MARRRASPLAPRTRLSRGSRRPGGPLSSTSSGQAGPLPGVIETGAAISNLTAGNRFAKANAGPAFGHGHSIVLLLNIHGPTIPDDDYVAFANDDGSFTAGDGFYVNVSSNGGASTAGEVVLVLQGIAFSWSTGAILTPGINVIAIAWGAQLRASINGAPVIQAIKDASYNAPGAASVSSIGADGSGTAPFAIGDVLQVKEYAAILTDTDLVTIAANGQDNRYALLPSAASEGSLTFDMLAARDWDGVAATLTTQGSAPVTYPRVGAPTKIALAERFLSPAVLATFQQDGGGISYARYIVRTTDAVVAVDTIANDLLVNAPTGCPVVKAVGTNGVFLQGTTAGLAVRTVTNVPTLGSGTQTIEFWDGPAYKPVATMLPSNVVGIRTSPSGLVSVTREVPPPVLWLAVGDSICEGQAASIFPSNSWGAIAREQLRGRGALVFQAYGYGSLFDLCTSVYASPAAAADGAVAILLQIAGGLASAPVVIMELETNDFGLNTQTPTAYQAMLLAYVDRVHARFPNAIIWLNGATRRTDMAVNAGGFTLAQYTAAMLAVHTARPFTFFYDFLNVPTELAPDGLHLTNLSHREYADQLLTNLALAYVAPTCTGATPVPTAGGNTTISGYKFLDGSTVTFSGGIGTITPSFVSGNALVCAIPATAAGNYDVTVTGPNGQPSATLPGALVVSPAPVLSSFVNTATGTNDITYESGVPVSGTGLHLTGAQTIKVGGVPVTGLTITGGGTAWHAITGTGANVDGGDADVVVSVAIGTNTATSTIAAGAFVWPKDTFMICDSSQLAPGLLATWPDATTRNAPTAAGAFRPLVVANQVNGLPALQVAASWMATPVITYKTALTFFIVEKDNQTSGIWLYAGLTNNSINNANAALVISTATNTIQAAEHNAAPAAYNLATATFARNAWLLTTITINHAVTGQVGEVVYKNNISQPLSGTLNGNQAGPFDPCALNLFDSAGGGNTPMVGTVAFMAAMHGVASAQARTNVWNHLQARYAL